MGAGSIDYQPKPVPVQVSALVALPPGNIVRELEGYRRSIFSQYGTLSSYALPVFLFISQLSDVQTRGNISGGAKEPVAVPEGELAGVPAFSTGGVVQLGRGLYLEIEGFPSGIIGREDVGSSGDLPEELLPLNLLLMAWHSEGLSTPPTLPNPPSLTWRRCSTEMVRISTLSHKRWWSNISVDSASRDNSSRNVQSTIDRSLNQW